MPPAKPDNLIELMDMRCQSTRILHKESGHKLEFQLKSGMFILCPDFVTQKCPFCNWLINNILYLCIPLFWGTQKVF